MDINPTAVMLKIENQTIQIWLSTLTTQYLYKQDKSFQDSEKQAKGK